MENLKTPIQRAIDAFNCDNVATIASSIKNASRKVTILINELKEYTKHRKENIGYDDLEIREVDIKAIEEFMHDANLKLQQFRQNMHGRKNKGAINMSEAKLEEFTRLFNSFEEELSNAIKASQEYKQIEIYRKRHKEEILELHKTSVRKSIPCSFFNIHEHELRDIIVSTVKKVDSKVVKGFTDILGNKGKMASFLSSVSNNDVDTLLSLVYVWHYNQDPFAKNKLSFASLLKKSMPDDPFENMDVDAFKRDVNDAFMEVYGHSIDYVPETLQTKQKGIVGEFLVLVFLSMFGCLREKFVGLLSGDTDPTYNLKNKFIDFIYKKCVFKNLPTDRTLYRIFAKIKGAIKPKSLFNAKKFESEINRLKNIMSAICNTPLFAKPFFA